MAGKIIYRDTILLMAFLTCFVFLAARDFAPAYADSMQRQGAGDDGSSFEIAGTALMSKMQFADAEPLFRKAVALQTSNPDFNRSLGECLMDQGKYANAEPFLRLAASAKPHDATNLAEVGYDMVYQNRLAEARTLFSSATCIDLTSYSAPLTAAGVFMASKDYLDAELYLRLLIARRPSNYGFQCMIGNVLYSEKNWSEAERYLRSALRTNVGRPDLQSMLEYSLLNEGKWKEYSEIIRKRVVAAPSSGPDQYSLGLAMVGEGNLPTAEPFLRSAIDLDPRCALYMFELGFAYALEGNVKKAIPLLESAVRLDAGNAEYKSLLDAVNAFQNKQDGSHTPPPVGELQQGIATVCADNQDSARSEEAAQTAVRLNPKQGEYRVALCAALLNQQKYETALTCIRPSVASEPQNDQYRVLLAVALSYAGKDIEAEQIFRKLNRLHPSPVYDYQIGTALGDQKKFSAAEPFLTKAVRSDPTNSAYAVTLAADYVALNEYSRAAALLKGIVQSNSGIPQADEVLGEALAGEGRYADAEGDYRAAIDAGDFNADTQYHLALTLCKVNNLAEAEGAIRKAMAGGAGNADYRKTLSTILTLERASK